MPPLTKLAEAAKLLVAAIAILHWGPEPGFSEERDLYSKVRERLFALGANILGREFS
jgi:hypothetical protein